MNASHRTRPATLRSARRLSIALVASFACVTVAQAYPRFAAPFLSYSTGFDTRGVAIADVDGDGRLDVIEAGASLVRIRRGAGDGSLLDPVTWPAGRGTFVVAGDFNSDGTVDLVTQGDSLSVGLLPGTGGGAFATPVLHPCPKAPEAAVVARLDGNTTLDLVTANGASRSVSVFLGVGDGTFARTDYPVNSYPRAIAVADFDGDDHLDLAVVNYYSGSVSVMANDGAGQFTLLTTVPSVVFADEVVAARLNGDGLPDLAVASSWDSSIYVHLATAPGVFAPARVTPVHDVNSGLEAVDLDADGATDLVTNGYYRNRITTLLGRGDGTFDPPMNFPAPRAPRWLAVGDLNGGGKPDVVVVSTLGSLAVSPGNGDGSLGGLPEYPAGTWPTGLVSADVNEDGELDVITADSGPGTVSVLLGAGLGTFGPAVPHAVGMNPSDVAIGDLNGDTHADLVVANSGPGSQSSSSISVLYGDGTGAFAPQVTYVVGRWPRAIGVGDLNGDSRPDVAVGGEILSVLFGQPGGGLSARLDFAPPGSADGLAIADATGDGHADVVVTAYLAERIVVYPAFGNGTWGTPISLPLSNRPEGVAVADVTHDGLPDLVVGNNGVSVFPGAGGGAYAPRRDYAAAGSRVAVADFDGDGRLDVVLANGWNSNTFTLLTQQPDGSLGERVDYGAGDNARRAIAADVDRDGLPDLVTSNTEAHSVSVVLNTGGQSWLRWTDASRVPPRAKLALRAWPNPARGALRVEFTLPVAGDVMLRAYDVSGRRLATLARGHFGAGVHTTTWARDTGAERLAPGVCFVELAMGGVREVRRVAVVR